jgi:DNA polymerase
LRDKEPRPEQRSLFDPVPEAEADSQGQEKAASEQAATSPDASPAMPSLFPEDNPARESPRLVLQPPRAVPAAPRKEGRWAAINDLAELKLKVLTCRACPLRDGARGVVFGEGDPHADIMFVGEGPGQTEDETGRPFVGRAGQLLDLMLKAVGLQRRQVFIANIIKCRPPGNRLPLPPEVQACLPNLEAQIRIIDPKIVVLLGALSSQTLVDLSIRVTRDRGKWFEKGGRSYLVTFHPAAVLRDEEGKRKLLLDDFKSFQAKWEKLRSGNLHDPK